MLTHFKFILNFLKAILLFVFFINFELCPSSCAKIPKTIPLSQEDIADIIRAQNLLNKTKTMKASFIQLSSNGEYAEGQLFLERPGKLRLTYKSPNPLMVVADGTYISYIDRELDEATTIMLSMTKAELLLRNSISFFSKDLTISSFKRAPGSLKIAIFKTNEPLEGNIKLIFSDSPLELRKWVVTDAHGITTTISLTDSSVNIPIDKKNFIYVPKVKPDLNPEN